jgi:hypothetical protein
MARLRGIEGGAEGGLDPRRARLSRIHDISILGLAASVVAFLLLLFTSNVVQWGPSALMWIRVILALSVVGAASCVATIFMVAFLFDADPRSQRERRQAALDEDEPRPEF